jgi:hypothetical protein
MCSHEPGSFTRIMAAMVSPRKTSSETTRPPRDDWSAGWVAGVLGIATVSAVAINGSSAGGIVQQQGKCRNAHAPGHQERTKLSQALASHWGFALSGPAISAKSGLRYTTFPDTMVISTFICSMRFAGTVMMSSARTTMSACRPGAMIPSVFS